MDVFTRRAILQGLDNPGGRNDYVTGLQGRMTPVHYAGSVDVIVRYVPDRMVVTPDSFEAYLETVKGLEWSCLEDMANAMVKDVSNEMLTRWTQVILRAGQPELEHIGSHEVSVEDRQPGWRNDDLIFRLAPL